MKPEEAIEIAIYCLCVSAGYEACEECKIYGDDDSACREVARYAIKALKEVQQYRKIGTIEEIRKMINQGINNCYMSHKYEHPGYEEGMCAGLRTMNGDGEPVYKCKLCRLNYLFERSEGE